MCILQTHVAAVTSLEPESLECIRNYKKSLIHFFSQHDLSPIFIETVVKQGGKGFDYKEFTGAALECIGRSNHTEIEVLPVPADRLKEARVRYIYIHAYLQRNLHACLFRLVNVAFDAIKWFYEADITAAALLFHSVQKLSSLFSIVQHCII